MVSGLNAAEQKLITPLTSDCFPRGVSPHQKEVRFAQRPAVQRHDDAANSELGIANAQPAIHAKMCASLRYQPIGGLRSVDSATERLIRYEHSDGVCCSIRIRAQGGTEQGR